MIGNQQDNKHSEPAAGEPPVTRRGMIKSQAKGVLALGITLLTATATMAGGKHHHHPPCFLRGTRLRTADGERNVEDIVAGDLLLTAFGQSRPVQWVGRWQARKKAGKPWSTDLRPVRIRQSALGPNTPYMDLYVSRGHAILVDGVLVPAGQLVNGTSITLHGAEEVSELEYFHVKLASHDVILAAGAPSESLLKYPGATGDLENSASYAGGAENETYCAPILCAGNRSVIAARVRGLATPWLGPQKIDIIRARLQQRATSLSC